MNRSLVVFAKYPYPSSVKTRLQTRFTPEQTARIYTAFILDTLSLTKRVPAETFSVACTPADSITEMRQIIGPEWDLFPQEEGDLGRRMAAASSHAFDGGADTVAIIGTDLPSLPPSHLNDAFDCLERNDVVIGPSVDGGYYLIGLSRPLLEPFLNIEWSTSRVFSQTVNACLQTGLSLGLVDPWYDVDTPEELNFLYAHATAMERAGQTCIPHRTMEVLSQMGIEETARTDAT